jgi:hypothetical protein
VVFLAKHGLWVISPTARPYEAVVDKAMLEAQQQVARAAGAEDVDDRARRHAEAVLGSFCRSLGWTISVRWRDKRS